MILRTIFNKRINKEVRIKMSIYVIGTFAFGLGFVSGMLLIISHTLDQIYNQIKIQNNAQTHKGVKE